MNKIVQFKGAKMNNDPRALSGFRLCLKVHMLNVLHLVHLNQKWTARLIKYRDIKLHYNLLLLAVMKFRS